MLDLAGARAVVDLHPFHLSVQDASGTTVLSEVANTGQLPQVEPPTTDPVSPGFDNPSTTSL